MKPFLILFERAKIFPKIVITLFGILFIREVSLTQIVLECDDFRLILDSTTHILECCHLPTSTTFTMYNFPTNIANTGTGETWDNVDKTTMINLAQHEKSLLFDYGNGKSSTMKVTQLQHFLEFELTNVTGACGDIRLFGPIFNGVRDLSVNSYGRHQLLDLGNGFFACIISGNEQTRILQWRDSSENRKCEMIYTISPAALPTPMPYMRGQKFIFCICRESELKSRIFEIEGYYQIPFGMSIKERKENNKV